MFWVRAQTLTVKVVMRKVYRPKKRFGSMVSSLYSSRMPATPQPISPPAAAAPCVRLFKSSAPCSGSSLDAYTISASEMASTSSSDRLASVEYASVRKTRARSWTCVQDSSCVFMMG